ncbi:MAG: tetratricopeptide repeat protein [Proteobacteria bacterium]|nr:tetratricopeptide repeat protein [Pseudomonadota bacterium]MDA1058326.1 tetratricopeptide repeat protein [Pseudomonadota bacterium]
MPTVDARGHLLTNASTAECAVFEEALAEFQTYTGDPVATIERAIEARPDFLMAHVMRAQLMLTGTEKVLEAEVVRSLDAADRLAKDATDRERRHLGAARAWADGDFELASRRLFDLTIDHPRDALALQVGHLCDFYTGNAGLLRDRIAGALPAWDEGVPGYHALLGMHAFGLEENGDYRRAEESGRQAVDLNPKDAWAIHAVAHVLEMEGRQQDGIDWMATRVADWSENSFFAVHNWWHWALYHLDLGEADKVLQFYDDRIRTARSAVVLDMVDASAMLWRLNLLGLDLGGRWEELAEAWAPHVEDGYYAFNDAHAMMAFVGARRDDLVTALLVRLEVAAAGTGTNAMMSRDVGLPLARALSSFGAGRYEDAVDGLLGLRYVANRFGGSNAQRDLLGWTLVEAALRAEMFALAETLTNQRVAQKSSSLQNWQLVARASIGRGNDRAAATAQDRAKGI